MKNETEKLTLANINMRIAEVFSAIESCEGELTDNTEEALKLISDKIIGGCFAIDSIRRDIAHKKEMVKELQASIRSQEKKNKWLTGAVLSAMDKSGTTKIESYKKFSITKNPGRVEVVDERLIPARFLRADLKVSFNFSEGDLWERFMEVIDLLSDLTCTETITPNKAAIKDAIKAGEDVQGAIFVNNEVSLKIK